MSSETIYLDNNATTKVAPEVIEAMLPYFGGFYGNPSSIHRFGGNVHKIIETAREQVAALINAKPSQVYFTGCGSESDNLALQGFYRRQGYCTKLITSAVEHHAVLYTCKYLNKHGAALTELAVDENGMLNLDDLKSQTLDERTLLSFMWANNETGVIFPIEKITEIAKERGALVHTDAVQAVGKLPIDVTAIPVDFLALSGHKLHAPKGIGAIFIRDAMDIDPLLIGGHQEGGVRAGTENVPYIVGLGKACEMAKKNMPEEKSRVRALRDRLEMGILATCKGAILNGHPTERLPNTTNISFEFIEGEGILLLLDEYGICASSGSACTTGSLEPSHVLRAMGIPYTRAHSATRFSLSRYTTEGEIDKVLAVLPGIVDKLRTLSPYIKSEEVSVQLS
jgi:cysteine desulfurase